MKTLICTTPGHLEFIEREKPVLREGMTIIRIKRIGICGTDLHAFEGTQPYFQYPRVLGHELAAVIEETSEKDFRIGDAVTIIPYFHCGHCIACRRGKPNCCTSLKVCGVHIDGGMTELLEVPSGSVMPVSGLELEELALIEPLAIAAHAVKRADITPGEFVLVMGAGPIGLGVMELAAREGAQVIAMDRNKDRLLFCEEKLKVGHIIDATLADRDEKINAITGGNMPTLVIDATGNREAIISGFSYLAHGGKYVLVGLQKEPITFSHPEFHKKEATLMSSRNATKDDFGYVIDCLRKKEIDAYRFITHRLGFDALKEQFKPLLNPANKVIKAIVDL